MQSFPEGALEIPWWVRDLRSGKIQRLARAPRVMNFSECLGCKTVTSPLCRRIRSSGLATAQDGPQVSVRGRFCRFSQSLNFSTAPVCLILPYPSDLLLPIRERQENQVSKLDGAAGKGGVRALAWDLGAPPLCGARREPECRGCVRSSWLCCAPDMTAAEKRD